MNDRTATNAQPAATDANPARRRRPHPARNARRIVGVAGIAGTVLLTGCMATGAANSGSAAQTTTQTATKSATATATASATASASAATPSASASTASNGS